MTRASVFEKTPTISGTVDTTGGTVSLDLDGDLKADVQVGALSGETTWTHTLTNQIDNPETINVVEGAVTTGTSFTADDSVTISYEMSVTVAPRESIQHAIDNIPAGGTINLLAGNYTSST